jgi:YesN/AraC family two-component response regulator
MRANHVDIAFLDLEMPGMTGLELLRKIRLEFPNVYCVILTMHQDFGYVQEALRQGALDYVLKVELEPESFDDVLGRILRRMQQDRSPGERQEQVYALDGDGECSAEILRCIQKAVRIIHEEPGTHLTAADVARRVNMSRSYFSLCFKKATGKSFNSYFRAARIEQAKEMLLNSRSSVKWIASACGFSDERYFSTIFRHHTGMLPREFRKKQG